jgi:hypothetical protein
MNSYEQQKRVIPWKTIALTNNLAHARTLGRRMTVPRRRCRPIGRHRGKILAPGGVFLRLIFVSLIVGAFLMWLDIRPEDIFRGIIQLVDRIWSLGFDAIREIAKYILAGAAIVVPVWLVLRLMNMRNAR